MEEHTPEQAFEKDAFQLSVEDVYDISYVIGRDFLKISNDSKGTNSKVSELQFKIVRVLEVLESLVNQSSLTLEELQMERDNLKTQVEKLLRDGPRGQTIATLFVPQQDLGADKMVVDLADPNRPRFTMEELRAVLQERNQLKAQLLVAQEELQCYKSGLITPHEGQFEIMEEELPAAKAPTSNESKEEKSIVKRFFSFK
ncbi:RILP-like protein 2 isoform X1 [Ambystoma mexicanum]|uniref:RILP-like protein 2 isoform X1 n=1 Tax=Ambystoma mexicanum TaxID=8296 RepID=UPI0037E733E2